MTQLAAPGSGTGEDALGHEAAIWNLAIPSLILQESEEILRFMPSVPGGQMAVPISGQQLQLDPLRHICMDSVAINKFAMLPSDTARRYMTVSFSASTATADTLWRCPRETKASTQGRLPVR